MNKIVEGNKELLKKLTNFKNRMIDIHIESTNDNSIETMSEIAKLKEVNDELKSALILLHTNNVTATKFNSESMVKNYNMIIDITSESITKQNELIDKLQTTHKALSVKSVLKKTKDYILEAKYKLIIGLTGVTVVLVGLHTVAPVETKYVLDSLLQILK